MATTALWRVKGYIGKVLLYTENPEKTTAPNTIPVPENVNLEALEDVISYTCREDATQERRLVYGINCSPDSARQRMLKTKAKWGKEDGTIAYHGYQSFKEGEVDPDTAHSIGIKLASELWGDNYEVVVSTHVDKESHIHNHFVINTVGIHDGIKFHRTNEDYRRMRDVSDRLCREYGLSVIKHPEKKGKHHSEWEAEKNGKPTWRKMIERDIDRAIKASVTMEQFYDALEDMGYTLKIHTASGTELHRPSLKPKGAKKFTRFDGLDEGYTLDDITNRILENIRNEEVFPETEIEAARRYRREHPPHTKAKGLQALYYYYCYELHIIIRHPASARVSSYMKEDILKLEQLDAQTIFLGENGIETFEDLSAYREKAGAEVQLLSAERDKLRNKLKRTMRVGDEDAVLAVKLEIKAVSDKIEKLRRSLKTADAVEERADRMGQELQAIKEQNMNKEELNELFRRRGGTGREDEPQRR